MLNLDWFQPYKHLTYSVGAIYLSVFNLPSQQRYKLENIWLIGIIPGPSEPWKAVNWYIDPSVKDYKSSEVDFISKFVMGQVNNGNVYVVQLSAACVLLEGNCAVCFDTVHI